MALIQNNTKVLKLFEIVFFLSLNMAFSQELKTVKAEKILKAIAKHKAVLLKNMIVEGDLDFTSLPSFRESIDTRSVKISSPIYFENCKFKGKIIGYHAGAYSTVFTNFDSNLSFIKCTLYQDFILNGAIIGTSLVFMESDLHGELHLENIEVGHDANFIKVIFGRKVYFQNGIYRKNAYFNKSIFNEVGYFQSCKWEGEAVFREAEFRENMDFSLQKTYSPMSFNFSNFKKVVFFDGSKFGDDFEIDNCNVEKIVLSNCQFWSNINFEAFNFKEAQFTDSIFYTKQPDFSKISNSTSILELSGLRFPNLLTK